MENQHPKKWTVIRKENFEETLAQKPTPGVKLLEPFKSLALKNNLPFKILEEQAIKGEAELHHHECDLWLCLEGESTFTIGGTLINPQTRKNSAGTENPNEVKGDGIKDGEEVILKPGDWLWIQEEIPHYHACQKTARLLIIKIPSKK